MTKDLTETLRDTIQVRDTPQTHSSQAGVWRFDIVEQRFHGHRPDFPFVIRIERIEGAGLGARVSPHFRQSLATARKDQMQAVDVVCGYIKDGKLVKDIISHRDAKGNTPPLTPYREGTDPGPLLFPEDD